MKDYAARSPRFDNPNLQCGTTDPSRSRENAGIGQAVGLQSTQPPERDHEIPDRLHSLHRALDVLSDSVALLRDRLTLVTTGTPPLQKADVRPSRTQLGSEMAELLSKVELIASGVNDLLTALEI